MVSWLPSTRIRCSYPARRKSPAMLSRVVCGVPEEKSATLVGGSAAAPARCDVLGRAAAARCDVLTRAAAAVFEAAACRR